MPGTAARPEPGRVAEPERGPAVLIVGGLLTSWLWYWPVETRFKARGASRVAVAPLWLWQWLVAGFLGPGRAASLVAASVDRLAACDGRPILVVGHSGGGMLARLALARESFDGTCLARRDSVGALVTVGTPHLATGFGGTLGRHGLRALYFLRRLDASPGPPDPFAILSVAGALPGDPPASGTSMRHRFSAMCYRALVGNSGPNLVGDGLVPQPIALLPADRPGRTEQPIGSVAHAPFLGSPWYLSDEGIDAWWSPAVELWRETVDRWSATLQSGS